MKKFLYTVLILTLSSISLFGQSTRDKYQDDFDYIEYLKNDIYIQYGTPTVVELTPMLQDNEFVSADGKHNFNANNYWYSGVAAVGYNRFLNPYVYMGAYFGVNSAGMSYSETKSEKIAYESTVVSYTALVSGSWLFYRSGVTELSAGLYLGISYKDETHKNILSDFKPIEKDQIKFAYHITAFKARFGNRFGGFVELGFGYRGIINAGLSIKI